MRVYLQIEVRRVDCRSCRAVKGERLDFLSENPYYTERFAFYVRRVRRHRTRQALREAARPKPCG
jgi:transposase